MPISRKDCSQLTDALVQEYHAAGYWTDDALPDYFTRLLTQPQASTAGVLDREGFHSWSDVGHRANQLAGHLVDLGTKPGDVIGVQLPNWWEFVVSYLAISTVGGVMCQFPPGYRAREVEFILGHSMAAAVIVPSSFKGHNFPAMIENMRPGLPHLRNVLVAGKTRGTGEILELDAVWSQPPITFADKDAVGPRADDVLRVAFTSGTTGDPKAVLHTHNTTIFPNLVANEHWAQDQSSRILLFLPAALNWGLFYVTEAILAGCTLVLIEDYTPDAVLDSIATHACTHFGTSPSGLVSLTSAASLKARDLSSMNLIVTGGAPTPLHLFTLTRETFGCPVTELYGMLETGVHSVTRVADQPESIVGTVGVPDPWMDTLIIDDDHQAVEPGTVGEIAVRGPSVTAGYYANDAANVGSFLPTGHFLTGDLGYFDGAGRLHIAGRKKDMIIHGGANVWAREVEEALYEHPAVREAAVIGLPDDYFGESICACIIPRSSDETPSLDDIVAFMEHRIARYKLPQRVEYMTAFPMTPTGKIQKFELVVRLTQSQAT